MDIYTGYIASLGAAFCWAICSICFTNAGKNIGALSVAFIRLIMAMVFYVAFGYISRGLPFPTDATTHTWIFMSLSGIVGFFIGDIFLFRSFLMIGPRLSLLIISIWPAMTAILAFFFLKETLSFYQSMGIVLTLVGIVFVISEKKKHVSKHHFKLTPLGVLFAFVGALGQAVGIILSKIGMQNPDLNGNMVNYDTFSASQIRTIAALVCFAVLFTVIKRWAKFTKALAHGKDMLVLSFGSLTGPFLGVTLSLIALKYISAGISATIASTAPILIIPLVIIFHKEKVSLRAIAGALIAVAGVVVLIMK